MSRKLTASDRNSLIRLASAMEKGSPERKAILAGLSSMQEPRRRSRRAFGDNKETRKMLERFIGHTVDKWEKAISTLYLNDLSKAYNQIDDFENIADEAENRLGEIHASHMDGSDYADFYDDLMSEIESLREAYVSAQHDLQQMVDDGMADDGYEDEVMEKMEDEVLPALEDAIAYFKRNSRVPRLAGLYRSAKKSE